MSSGRKSFRAPSPCSGTGTATPSRSSTQFSIGAGVTPANVPTRLSEDLAGITRLHDLLRPRCCHVLRSPWLIAVESHTRTKEEPINVDKSTQSRMSNPLVLVPELREVSVALSKASGNGSVPSTTIGLIGLRACQIAGNTYTLVRALRELRDLGESEDRIDAVASWWDAPYFTDAERVALALVDAVLRPSTAQEKVPDELYARAAEHYDAKALATLTIAIGQANFWMPVALIGKPLPGMPPAKTWT